jgi:hypothetical protein
MSEVDRPLGRRFGVMSAGVRVVRPPLCLCVRLCEHVSLIGKVSVDGFDVLSAKQ